MVKLTNRIEALRMRDDDPDDGDLPSDAQTAAKEGVAKLSVLEPTDADNVKPAGRLSRAARSAIFREVVLAKVKEMKAEEEKKLTERTLSEKKTTPGKK